MVPAPKHSFENPYTKEVTLQVVSLNPNNPPTPLDQSQTTVNVNEAIYAFYRGHGIIEFLTEG